MRSFTACGMTARLIYDLLLHQLIDLFLGQAQHPAEHLAVVLAEKRAVTVYLSRGFAHLPGQAVKRPFAKFGVFKIDKKFPFIEVRIFHQSPVAKYRKSCYTNFL